MDELYHYGVKGMKWGIRRKPTLSKKKNNRTLSLSKNDLNHGKRKTPAKISDLKKSVYRGKKQVDRFMQTKAGMVLKSAAFIGLASIGVPTTILCVGNYLAFGQSPIRTLGLDSADVDAKYESMRGITLGPIERY